MLHLFTFEHAHSFMDALSESEQLKIAKAVAALRTQDFGSIHVKTIRGPIKELIVRKSRILFCIENETLYLLNAFSKKSVKTPRNEIEIAENIYRLLINPDSIS
jgi:phage-related protein